MELVSERLRSDSLREQITGITDLHATKLVLKKDHLALDEHDVGPDGHLN